MTLPWLLPGLVRLASLDERIPHALLLYGRPGIGKRVLGRSLARALLCESTDRAARTAGGCGRCLACGWFDHGNHPDYRSITSEAIAVSEGADLSPETADGEEAEPGPARSKRVPSKEIKVDQIRALQGFLSIATHRSRFRVVLLRPLEAVNVVAANALLKMLEEPPPGTVFILVGDHLGRVPATILSRCRKVPVPTPTSAVATAWLRQQAIDQPDALLALCGGAPLAALALASDGEAVESHRALVGFLSRPEVESAIATAEGFAKSSPAPLVRWVQQWVADCITMRLGGGIRYHPTQSSEIRQLADRARLDALMDLMQRLNAIRRSIDHPLNARLTLESLLMAYADAVSTSTPEVAA